MNLFEFLITEAGIERISIVESPAIEVDFITLGKKMQFKEVERKVLLGAALIPDKPIYREYEDGTPYYGYFSKNTVRKIAEKYMSMHRQSDWNVNHSEQVEGVNLVESWIIEGEKDKSQNYGFDLPQGTWMVTVKPSDAVWEEYVKTGKLKGFSIEGNFELSRGKVAEMLAERIKKELKMEVQDRLRKELGNREQ